MSWHGPAPWVYAPKGFTVERRGAERVEARDCEVLTQAALAELRALRELRLRWGVVAVRDGEWMQPFDVAALATPTPCEIFRFDLDDEHRAVRMVVRAKLSFAVVVSGGRCVGVGQPAAGPATHIMRATRFDAIVLVALAAESIEVCLDAKGIADVGDWSQATVVASGLTLPLRELMPSLATDADELAEARTRLRPGEAIGAEEFARLTHALRPVVRAAGPSPPAQWALLLRDDVAADPDEARGLDPLRVMLVHPTWRRALGFMLFDDDPALVVGTAYEYRVRATFPGEHLRDTAHTFTTVPSTTLLPTDFSVGGIRFRVPQPPTVELEEAIAPGATVASVRRGIRLQPQRDPWWTTPSLNDWSVAIDLPASVGGAALVLEVAAGHELEFVAGDPADPFDTTLPVPPGEHPVLPIGAATQVRLKGKAFLHGVHHRVGPPGPLERSAVTPPIVLTETAPPAAPFAVAAENLQRAYPVPVGLVPVGDVPAREPLGFRVSWTPVVAFGLTAWPPGADVAPPLDATIFEVERRTSPGGPWEPILDDGNWTFGDRDVGLRDLDLLPGGELLDVFPEFAGRRDGATLELSAVDTFDGGAAGTVPGAAAAPTPGTLVGYRARAVDSIGRPSPTWTESAPVRLEKHVPPPVPVEVTTRVLVRDAADLTSAEVALLGASDNVVLLRWAWTPDQRALDPLATEFRVYLAPPMDAVDATITNVVETATGFVTTYTVSLTLASAVAPDAAAGLRLEAGHPFFIRSHTGGTTVQMQVETRLRPRGAVPVPRLGPVRLNVRLSPERSRPAAWGSRVTTLPITAAAAYEVEFRDRLHLDAEHPTDTVWVGVSSADGETYVADQLAPAETRVGNESSIVAASAVGRYAGRPVLDVPPPLAPVPRIPTPEPGHEPTSFSIDLSPFLPPAALAAARVRAERVAAGELLAACASRPGERIVGLPVDPRVVGDAEVEISIPNPSDRTALHKALRTGRSRNVDDRFLVYLAGHHPYRDRLFTPASGGVGPPGPVDDTIPPAVERWLYRVRAVDAAGHVSSGAATAAVVVAVPSPAPGSPPRKLGRRSTDALNVIRLAVDADPQLTHLLVFSAPIEGIGPVRSSEIMRVPNRPDLFPEGGLWLRAPNGDLLTPQAIALDGPQSTVLADGSRELAITVPVAPDGRMRAWFATLTSDRVPSAVAGPYSVVMPVGV